MGIEKSYFIDRYFEMKGQKSLFIDCTGVIVFCVCVAKEDLTH